MNILIKNMLDCLIGAITYWSLGWALAYGPGGNGFAGGSEFFAANMDASSYPSWFFQVRNCHRESRFLGHPSIIAPLDRIDTSYSLQFVFAAAAATIVSGSVAERVQINAYFVYSVLITGKSSQDVCFRV